MRPPSSNSKPEKEVKILQGCQLKKINFNITLNMTLNRYKPSFQNFKKPKIPPQTLSSIFYNIQHKCFMSYIKPELQI